LSIRRNTAYNLLGALIPLAASLVTIPIGLRLIGEARYGVLAVDWLLVGCCGLFELGSGGAGAQRVAES
jgi:O-antigen/teichoic acid export membrane protein